MKRLLWMTTIFLALMSCRGFADTLIKLFPNDGGGDNFSALQRNGADFIIIGGGTTTCFYDTFCGYPPGSSFEGQTALFVDFGLEQIAGHQYDLQSTGIGTLNVSGFTFPATGQSFQVPVSINFSVDMINLETLDLITVSGFASGHMAFSVADFDGLYHPVGGFATPEPGTLRLMTTGLFGVLTLARGRLRSR